jgi:hypothetical protein
MFTYQFFQAGENGFHQRAVVLPHLRQGLLQVVVHLPQLRQLELHHQVPLLDHLHVLLCVGVCSIV